MVNIMEIDISAFWHNIYELEKLLEAKTKIMPVIKANAYGTFLNERLDILNKFEIVAVANVYEAKKIRNLGYEKEIFVLNQPDILELPEIEKYNITIGLSSIEFLKEAILRNNKIKIHIEIETGMGRTGVYLKDLDEFIGILNDNKNIKLEGIYTHFAVADYDLDFTNIQIQKFEKAVSYMKSIFKNKIKYVHSQASNGILNTKVLSCNFVRPGIIMYGYESFDEASQKIDLKPVAKLKSKINYIKIIEKGESVSYGRKFIANKETKVATVPIGYADGIRRILSNRGEVVVNGQKASIIGTICMDSFMIDVTNISNIEVGNEVYIWDNEIIKLDEIAKKCDTINYEILTSISNRVERKFIGGLEHGK